MWNTFHNIGVECGVTANDVSVFGRLSDEAFAQYSSGAMSADAANESLRSSTKSVGEAAKQTGKNTQEAGEKAQKTSKAFVVLTSVLVRLAHTALSAVTRSFREALTEMKNVDSELVVVRKVSNATAEELSVLKDRAYEVGAAYGVAASDYLNAAAEMTRAGYREQAGDLAELATKLQLVGDVSQETANQFLIATDKAYKMNGDFVKLSSTIDKLNEIDTDGSEKWICMPLVTYIDPVHTAVNKEVHNEKEVLQNTL
jgi:ribosomal protein S24E